MAGSPDQRLAELETRLGHTFANRGELARAVTHRSAVTNKTGVTASYQRHEFLGDRVLALVIAELLFTAYPEADEGELARRLNQLVRRETCAEVARELDLGAALRLGSGERQSGGSRKEAILGDVMEAVLAAIYRDAGFEAARAFVTRHWGPRMQALTGTLRDAKTTVQEWAQGQGLPTPAYEIISRSGPDHAPHFVVRVIVAGVEPTDGRGGSRREAEQAAATAMLVREGVWTDG